jgi:multidrug efflux pump subunit AcrB
VEGRINRFFLNLLQGLVVVGLIVLIGVGIRAAAIVMTAIPVSFLIGLGFVHLTGYGLQQMSIVGLVIALGLLVDNAIVVTENVSRFIEQGVEPREAAARGAGQIGWAVVSATVTTVLAFIPIVLLRDMTGDFIRSMPVTVIYTLTASLLVALTLTPYLSSLLLRRSGKSRGFSRIVARDRGGRPERGGRPAPEGGRQPQPDAQRAWHRAGGAVQNTFGRMLGFALSHRILTVALTVAVFGAALGLFPLLGSSLFPKAEKPQFIINVEAPEGTSLDRTDQLTRLIEEDLLQREQIGHVAANIGKGNPRIYYNLFSLGEKPNQAQLFVQLKRYDYREMQELIADLRQTYAEFTGASVEVKELLQGPPVEAPIAIKILGENLDVLQELARDVEALVGSVPGTVNVDNPLRTGRTDLLVSINREKAGILNVPVAEIDRTVRAGITGLEVSRYRDPAGEEFDIVIRLPIDGKASISDFDRIYVSAYGSAAPAIIPLGQLARLEFEQSPVSINHYNLERAATITADVVGDQSVDQATREVLQKLDQYSWPRGYRYEVAGEFESREESFGGLRQAFLIALAAIFAVLVLQFRSYTQPLIVFSAIPLAIIGSVAALFITGNDFSFSAFVGLTGLIGIVVNNSILLVEYANHLREEGAGLSEAVREAARVRFKPIMLTTCTTVGGLLPLTLQGGTLWAPFGWTIIGGLATSTVLTLVVVPVFYTFFTPGEMKAGPYPS